MVKHSGSLMGQFFTRERFGHPQVLAGFLLLLYLAQCVWLVNRSAHADAADPGEVFRIQQGLRQWRGQGIAGTPYCAPDQGSPVNGPLDLREFGNSSGFDRNHSPLWYLTASAPLLLWPRPLQVETMSYWIWLARAPHLVFGLLLGASLWYVSRRLYGNQGGYIALTLYCFSPGLIRTGALWFAQPELGAAWGAFGAIFTAIAVAHTLYAPREVVLWNWRRIVLLGLSLVLAIGAQFSLVILIPLALAFMLYLAPTRRRAAVAIWGASCAVACVLLCGAYSFHPRAFWEGVRQANFFSVAWSSYAMPAAYRQVLEQLGQNSPTLLVAAPAALVAYLAWPRARYFGNHAPLLVALLFLFLAVGTPHFPGLGFQFMALPFLFVFVAGVSADLLETRPRGLVQACVWGLLTAQAVWNVWELCRIARS
jgi:hypothetical protein